ncbi:MAG TPA: AbgT family transporter [Prolixibacteraceae bacterium]|nr:AbgT family transporter [Prolixibacteraceae bacterium]
MSRKFPHTYVIIFILILLAAMTTLVVPAGQYERELIDSGGSKRELIKPGSYMQTEAQPQTWQVFSAFYKGFVRSPGIIVFILILGGVFWILNESKAIDSGVTWFLRKSTKLEKYALFRQVGIHNIIITLVMLMFSFFGAIFGMSEETIAFVIIFVPLAVSMGYDSIVGICMCFIGAGIGFAGCLLNPFTLGIAQEISGIPLFSGIEYRLVIWMVINIVGIGYVLFYASRIRKRPALSPVYQEDDYWRNQHSKAGEEMEQAAVKRTRLTFLLVFAVTLVYAVLIPVSSIQSGNLSLRLPLLPVLSILFAIFGWVTVRKSIQFFVLNLLFFTILYLMVGVMSFGWGLKELAALFFALGLAAGFSMGKSPNDITRLFIAGAKDILSAALVVGLAGGIIVILEDGRVIDTFLHAVATSMQGLGKVGALSVMYGFQSALNMVITSGTAKAALIMPILRDISEMIGLSKQATVTAFHIGDGFTNLITPTSGVLIGVLEMARIPFHKWFKWAWKLILLLTIIGFLLLIPTVTMKLPGF